MRDLIAVHGEPSREVYLDSENSGLIYPKALEQMVRSYKEIGYGNPSITHKIGWESYEVLFKSTEILSKILNTKSSELAYTHGATEANNLAILGSVKANKNDRKEILVSSIEHFSVIFPAERLQEQGYKIIKIPVNEYGFIDNEFLKNKVNRSTFLVSIAPINHEIGTIQNLREIIDIVKEKNSETIFHTDAADSFGRVRLDLNKLNLDLASFSSHKVYGPKGVGLLYIKEGLKIEPILHGQHSSQKLWPGVENIPAIAGFAEAAKIFDNMDKNILLKMRDKLIENILSNTEHVLLNGPEGTERSPDNVNLSFLFVEGEAIIVELSMQGIYASSGSACTSRVLEPSHVLIAIGRRYEEAHGSVLMRITPFNNEDDINYVIEHIPKGIARLRTLSPIKGG